MAIKINKAIEILSDASQGVITINPDFKDAQNLGIEALKRFLRFRQGTRCSLIEPLPGEDMRDYGR